MKYAPSIFIGRLSRSAGSTTASHNRFGAYFRNRVIPTNAQTVKQMAVRASLGNAAAAWRGLTAARRAAWTAFGALVVRTDTLGKTYSLTGEQSFILTRRNLTTVSAAFISDPPAYTPPTGLATFAVTAGVGTQSGAFTPTPLGANEQLIILATRPLSAGVSFAPRGAYKLILVGAAATTSPQSLTAPYAAVFGTPPVGTKILYRGYVINNLTGLASAISESSVIVT